MIRALLRPPILLAPPISGAVIGRRRAAPGARPDCERKVMIGGLNVAAIAFALAACAVTIAVVKLVDRALHRVENRRAPQPDEAQLLLALLCEQLHERWSRTARRRGPSST
jgi:hypothetical protein